tara:strand:+ start:208 stop:1305 length:1098 start_codon:yes stop_codon:yes gene_type:complete
MRLKTLKFNQNGIDAFLCKVKVSEVWNGKWPISKDNIEGRFTIDQKNPKNKDGYQRPAVPKRWRDFGDFMNSNVGFCPVPLVANVRIDSKNGGKCLFDEAKSSLEIPDSAKLWICEGQHRFLGYIYRFEELGVDTEFPLVIMNQKRNQEVINFYYINQKQKAVQTDLANINIREYIKKNKVYLFGIRLSDEKQLAIDITKSLNEDPGGPFYNLIQSTGSGIKSTIKAIPMHNVIEEVVKKVDMVCHDDDELVPMTFKILTNAWKAIRELMPESFNDSNNYVTLKSAGIYSINRVIADNIINMSDYSHDSFYQMFKSHELDAMMTDFWWKSKDGADEGAAFFGSSQISFRRIQKNLNRGIVRYLRR